MEQYYWDKVTGGENLKRQVNTDFASVFNIRLSSND